MGILTELYRRAGVATPRSERGAIRDEGAEPEGLALHPDELVNLHASMHIIAKDAMNVLCKHYPGWRWGVQPYNRGQVINILNLSMQPRPAGEAFGYTIRMDDLRDDPNLRAVRKAGAELLRAFGYEGSAFNADRFAALPRDQLGNVLIRPDCLPKGRKRTQAEIELAVAEGRAEFVTDATGSDGSSGVILQIKG